MTIVSTASMTDATAALVAEVGGSSSNQVDIMIGIGLVKDSEAVFFQYVGEGEQRQRKGSEGEMVNSRRFFLCRRR